MNRKQRRAELKRAKSTGGAHATSAAQLREEALRLQQQGRSADAVRAYKRLLAIDPQHAEANNNLACLLQAQGQQAQASAYFARALRLQPQLFEQFGPIVATLVAVLPPFGGLLRRANEAWPQRLSLAQLAGGELGALAADPLLCAILQSSPARDIALERALTLLRAALLDEAAANTLHDDALHADALTLCCTLAQQCFINEYVFATTAAEEQTVARIKAALPDIAPAQLAVLAMYEPLHRLPDAQALAARQWPADIDALVAQQLREPMQERALRETIPRLTSIADATSQRVRQMYEENPYPRWVHAAAAAEAVTVTDYLGGMFPAATLSPLPAGAAHDVLVAGCGTGAHAIGFAQKFGDTQLLAIDLSLASLAYAKRQTPPALAPRIDYGQADILALDTLDRHFDVIDASGVLHHLADPYRGWRVLLGLLRPGGLMHLGLYSERGRRAIVEARQFIAARGYRTSASDIRRCRQDLMTTPLKGLAQFNDFFTTSECRDLLFHVQENRTTIPEIKSFLAAQNLRFIGFEFSETVSRRIAGFFAQQHWALDDLDCWHAFETTYPDTFSGMYQFWVQKAPGTN